MRQRTVSKHASWWKEWAKLGCPNPVQMSASLVGMVCLHQLRWLMDDVPNSQSVQMVLYCSISPVSYGVLVLKTRTLAIFVQSTWNLCHLKEHYVYMLNQVLFVAWKRLFLKILYQEWCINSTLWLNWQYQPYGGNKVLYKRCYLMVQKLDYNPWYQGNFCCIGEGVPHQLLMGYGEAFLCS